MERLHLEIQRGTLEEVKKIIGDLGDVNSRDKLGETPLLLALKRRHSTIVDFLLSLGDIDINASNANGWTPLMQALANGDEPTVDTLLANADIDVNARNLNGMTALSIAAQEGYIAIADRLLGMNCDPNVPDYNGNTPLLHAIVGGHEPIVWLLLSKEGVNKKCRNYSLESPLWLAVSQANKSRLDERMTVRVRIIELLLETEGIELNSEDVTSRTPLLLAIQQRNIPVVEMLLQLDGIDVNCQDSLCQSPLSLAVENEDSFLVGQLLAKPSINPECRNASGRTPLLTAVLHQNLEIVNQLLTKGGINIFAEDREGSTPVFLATYLENAPILDLLFKWDYSILYPHRSRKAAVRTALSWAVEHGSRNLVSKLLDGGSNPNLIDHNNHTPLWFALERGKRDIISLLVSKDTITLPMLVREGKRDHVKQLIDADCNVNVKDSFKRTVLHTALSYGYSDIAKDLVLAGAKLNYKDIDGMTPLSLAIRRKDLATTRLLLERGVQVKGIMAEEWFDMFRDEMGTWTTSIRLRLLEGPERTKNIQPVFETSGHADWARTRPDTQRRLLLTTEYEFWQDCVAPELKYCLQSDRSRLFYHDKTHDPYVSFSVACWLPQTSKYQEKDILEPSNWSECAIGWTLIRAKNLRDGSSWRAVDHVSMLPCGWIPDDGVNFFMQFIVNLKGAWLKLCRVADEHLSKRRMTQLRQRGGKPGLVHDLAADAQKWTELRAILQGQIQNARTFAEEYCNRYNEAKGMKDLQQEIDDLAKSVNDRINGLDQTVRDLLQFEFAWVSINEAHRSSSIATSIQRLSWVTFIFLPAMFASSLFGMNVNLLKDNPDWRWYLLFAAGFLIMTVVGWLAFKYNPHGVHIGLGLGNTINNMRESWATLRRKKRLAGLAARREKLVV